MPTQNLAEALARMRFRVEDGDFVLAGARPPLHPGAVELLAAPSQLIVEDDELTFLVPCAQLPRLRALQPELRVEEQLAWVRFECPMGWELVGFLAHVTGALAAAGVPLGAVCGFSRDHLFIARRHLEKARRVLLELFPSAVHDD